MSLEEALHNLEQARIRQAEWEANKKPRVEQKELTIEEIVSSGGTYCYTLYIYPSGYRHLDIYCFDPLSPTYKRLVKTLPFEDEHKMIQLGISNNGTRFH